MIKELWNVGLKVTDLDREVAHSRGRCVACLARTGLDGRRGTRIRNPHAWRRPHCSSSRRSCSEILFPVAFGRGLTHAVYEVDELDAKYARIRALGAGSLVEPTEVSAAFGRRRLAFFRSPSGFVFEVMQVLEREDLTPVGDPEAARHRRGASHFEVGADFKQDVWLREWIAGNICEGGASPRRVAVV